MQEVDVVGIPEGAADAWKLLVDDANEDAAPMEEDTQDKKVRQRASASVPGDASPSTPAF
jgi:hypothetical protein